MRSFTGLNAIGSFERYCIRIQNIFRTDPDLRIRETGFYESRSGFKSTKKQTQQAPIKTVKVLTIRTYLGKKKFPDPSSVGRKVGNESV